MLLNLYTNLANELGHHPVRMNAFDLDLKKQNSSIARGPCAHRISSPNGYGSSGCLQLCICINHLVIMSLSYKAYK